MLIGGTAGTNTNSDDNSFSSFGSFVRPKVKFISAQRKKTLDIRILPAFDHTFNLEDPAFDTSYIPYRERSEVLDEDTQTEAFTSWFYMVQGYTFFGFGRKQFLSPLTGVSYYPAGHDPIRDTWKYIDQHITDPNVKHLAYGKTVIDQATGKERKLPGYLTKTPRTFALLNILVEGEVRDQWENAILCVTGAAMRELKRLLSIQSSRSDTVVITPDWSDYYYGDITAPSAGAAIRVQDMSINLGTRSINCAGFNLEQAPKSPQTHNLRPFPITEQHLAGRYRIFDTKTVTNLPPKEEQYQTMLDYLVEDGVIPLEILEAACGRFGQINGQLYPGPRDWFEQDTTSTTGTVAGNSQSGGTLQSVGVLKSAAESSAPAVQTSQPTTVAQTPAPAAVHTTTAATPATVEAATQPAYSAPSPQVEVQPVTAPVQTATVEAAASSDPNRVRADELYAKLKTGAITDPESQELVRLSMQGYMAAV